MIGKKSQNVLNRVNDEQGTIPTPSVFVIVSWTKIAESAIGNIIGQEAIVSFQFYLQAR